jgi:hypothetical protein
MSQSVAREYFGLPSQVKVIIGDARTETLKLSHKYDVIVLDAFSGDTPPFHLLTREAFEGLKDRLEPDGLIVANIVGSAAGPGSRVIASVVETMEPILGKVRVFAPNRKLAGGDNDQYVSTTFIVVGMVAGDVASNAPAFPFPFPENMRTYIDTVLKSEVTVSRKEARLLSDARFAS